MNLFILNDTINSKDVNTRRIANIAEKCITRVFHFSYNTLNPHTRMKSQRKYDIEKKNSMFISITRVFTRSVR